MLLTGVVNGFVDPLGKVHDPLFGLYYSSEREQKSRAVKYFPHNALLIGSSRVASINPDDVDCPGLTFFNAAFSSAQPEEIYNFLDLYANDVDMVVIGLDVFMFNEKHYEYSPRTFRENGFDDLGYFFSANTLGYSVGAFKKWMRGKEPNCKSNGQRNMSDKDQRDRGMEHVDYVETLAQLAKDHYANVHFSQRRIEILSDIERLMQDRGIRVVFFWNPINNAILEMVRSDRQMDEFYEKTKRDVRQAIPAIADYSGPEFSGSESFYKFDPVHYYSAVGAQVVKQLLADSGSCDQKQ
ncbi:MAG: hypothetical protein JEY79_19110 [Pseudodesulfovibrio sp.]|nr:hypothetical protein [Pseudodesulfovibrio sp.]